MKKITLFLWFATFLCGCATVQAIIKSTFPYTAHIVIPEGTSAETAVSVRSEASSFDEIFGNTNGTSYVEDIRMASAKINAIEPSNQNLGIFRSIKVFLSDGDKEIMVASRSDIQENIGNTLALDIDNSKQLDAYIDTENLQLRVEYVLRRASTGKLTLRASLGFVSQPNKG